MKIITLFCVFILAASSVGAMDRAAKGIYLSRVANNTRLPAIVSVYEDADRSKPTHELVRVASGTATQVLNNEPLRSKITAEHHNVRAGYQSANIQTLFKIEPQKVPQLALTVWVRKIHLICPGDTYKLGLVYYISESPGVKFRREEPTLSKDDDIAVGITLDGWELPHVRLSFNFIH